MTSVIRTEHGQVSENTEVRYFNGRRYHVLTTHSTLVSNPAYRHGTRCVFVNNTHMISWRSTVAYARGFLPSQELEPPF